MKFRYLLILITSIAFLISCSEKEKSEKKEKVTKSKKSETLFKLLNADSTGIAFNNTFSPEAEIEFFDFQYQFNGGGVAIADFNNDGLSDVYFTGNEVSNKLYLNKGNLKFEDITESSGTSLKQAWSNGVSVIDINNDGFLDIYVSKGGNRKTEKRKNALLINNGDLTFTDKAQEYGIADTGWSTQSIFLDFDNDNDLDLFVLNHPNIWKNDKKMSRDNYKNAVRGEDHFYVNENGKYIESSKKVGLKVESFGGHGLGVTVGDLDQNGYPDLYVSNDYDEPDYMYMNQGDGTFKEEVKKRTTHIALYSMGSDIADFNNDGLMDFIALDMSAEDHFRLKTQMGAMAPQKFYELVRFGLPHQYMYNTLQLNNGNGTFSDVAQIAGVGSTDWSWAPLFADFDNDGQKDLLVTNGYRLDDRDNDFNRLVRVKYPSSDQLPTDAKFELFKSTPSTPLSNYVYKNNGDFTFSKKTYEWGLSKKGFTQGAAFGDLDNDGDLDLVMNNIEDLAFVYENKSENLENNYLTIKVIADQGTRIGALIKVKTGNTEQTQQVQPTRGYLSSSNSEIHFGLGDFSGEVEISIEWKDGTVSKLNSAINQSIEVSKESNLASSKIKTIDKQFEKIENELGINFTHVENKYDDFKKEILLPHRNSQHGPGMAVGDLNEDGFDDIYMGGAHNQTAAIYFQNKNGSFTKQQIPVLIQNKKHEDLGALIYDYDNDGDNDLYVVSGGNEFEPKNNLYQDRLYENKGRGVLALTKGILPKGAISGKAITAGDYDNDGDLDLFVGGRLEPGKYPFPAESRILEFDNGKYINVTDSVSPEIKMAGLVTNAKWIDYDNDKDLDLIVVGEWMPIMLLKNENGKLTWDKSSELDELVGWWSGLITKDFDGDGDEDFMVGNLGLNYKYKASKDAPFQIWCNDFDENGSFDIVLGYYDHGACYPVRGRQCSSQQMPFIKEKYPTYNEFASATIKDVYGEKLKTALNYQATTFESVYVENQGSGKFKISALPKMSQFSMITDFVSTKDKEVVLGGNLYTAEVETPRADASIGLVLRMNSKNEWVAYEYSKTGLYIPGDVKQLEIVNTYNNGAYIIAAKNDSKVQVIKIK
ncbi:MAG: VCBS repeat-containing protein [Salibacteraceae bacterium]